MAELGQGGQDRGGEKVTRRLAHQILADRKVSCPECGAFLGLIVGDQYPQPSAECCRKIVEDIHDLRKEAIAALRLEALRDELGVTP